VNDFFYLWTVYFREHETHLLRVNFSARTVLLALSAQLGAES
jgi:hypothetical protein